MSTIITNIKLLAGIGEFALPLRGTALRQMNSLADAWIIIEEKEIVDFGSMADIPRHQPAEIIDGSGRIVMPAWCDSHTHLVFPATRENEFIDKINGLSYADIAARGGGILNSAAKLAGTDEDTLYRDAFRRLHEISKLGTASVEIKSGYGLSIEGELKMLRVIKKLKQHSSLNIKASFLGAHSFPKEFRNDREGYIRLILEEMLPVIAAENLADYIDVFCEEGFYTPEETETICRAGLALGLKAKIHANQLHLSGGVQAGVRVGALSVDHLETMDEPAIDLLAKSSTIGTMLPTAALFLRMTMPPARTMIDKGTALALASDFNPGSSPSGNMNLVVALACIQMRMLPEEAINAATINGACAMELQKVTGSIAKGKQADLIMTTPVPSLAYLPYSFGSNLVEQVFIKGERI